MSRTHDVIISAFDIDRLESELAAVTKERDELKEDRDAWKSEALIMDARLRGVKHPNDNGIFSPDEVIPKLEREIASVKEQRDRLAEAALAVVDRWETPFWKQVEHTGVYIAALRKAVEEVKGGQP